VNRTHLILPALAAGTLALGAAAPAGAEAASRCTALKATHVTIVPGADTVTVKWRAPRVHPPKLAYRVARGGQVIGQTSGTRMRVRVSAGVAARITVTAVVGGRKTHCRVVRVFAGGGKVRRGAPGAVKGLAARSAGPRKVRLTWDSAARGSKPIAGYRVLRGGRALQTTRKLSLVLRVRGRKASRIQVAAVDRAGRMGPRSGAVTIVAGHTSPSVPSGLAASDVSPTAATLSWGRSTAVRGRIAGYRLLRDGRTVGGVKGTSTRLANLISAQSHTYQVLAVDSLGWASNPSDTVNVTTGHDAPGAPSAPTAVSIADTTITLAWDPAALPAGSRLRGYRLIRDGKVVAQVAGTRASVGNLAAKSVHDWSVATVDTLGYTSVPSPASRIVQGDPDPTRGGVHAFLLASTSSSFTAFRTHYRQVGVVYPTFYDCNLSSGRIVGANDQQIVTFARDRRVKVMPRFNCQDTDVIHRILNEPGLRSQWIDGMTSLAVQNGWDGVNVDLEAADAAERNPLTSFMAELSGRLHAQGKLLSQAVSAKTADDPSHPRSGTFDYAELSKYNDYTFVMAWGIHWATSAPGAQDHMAWVRQVRDYVASMPLKSKFVMGTMLYAMDWPAGGGKSHPAGAWHYAELAPLMSRYGGKPVFDPDAESWHYAYTDGSGVPHDVWYSDAGAVGDRVALARERGLGVGFWRIGQEDDRIWSDPRLPAAG
jgi:spore germination protein